MTMCETEEYTTTTFCREGIGVAAKKIFEEKNDLMDYSILSDRSIYYKSYKNIENTRIPISKIDQTNKGIYYR